MFAYALYFVWWYAFAYGLGGGNPDDYTYVLGLPAWFFYSCIVGYPLITLTLWGMVRLFFKEMPLEDVDDGPGASQEGAPTSSLLSALSSCSTEAVTGTSVASSEPCGSEALASCSETASSDVTEVQGGCDAPSRHFKGRQA